MKNILFVIVGLIIGSVIVFFAMPPIQNSTLDEPVKYNCELSTGEFVNGECECHLEGEQTQELMYDSATGFCQTTYGGPGGDAFQASIGLPHGYYSFWTSIVLGLCTDSGGTISGVACICPSPLEYSQDTGRCE